MKLGLLFAPDLRRVARQIQEAHDDLRRALDTEGDFPPDVSAEIVSARERLADVLESLTGRRPPG